MAINTIYKICSNQEWQTACASKIFAGAAIDLQDGFIHFSTAAQVKQTARLHFKERDDLLLIGVEVLHLEPDLKWEISRGGKLFPHLYGVLPVVAVKSVTALPLGADGRHVFPPLED